MQINNLVIVFKVLDGLVLAMPVLDRGSWKCEVKLCTLLKTGNLNSSMPSSIP